MCSKRCTWCEKEVKESDVYWLHLLNIDGWNMKPEGPTVSM